MAALTRDRDRVTEGRPIPDEAYIEPRVSYVRRLGWDLGRPLHARGRRGYRRGLRLPAREHGVRDDSGEAVPGALHGHLDDLPRDRPAGLDDADGRHACDGCRRAHLAVDR